MVLGLKGFYKLHKFLYHICKEIQPVDPKGPKGVVVLEILKVLWCCGVGDDS